MPPRLNIPPVTRILLIVLGVQSILSAAIRYRQWSGDSQIVIPYLTLIPQLSLVYPWTFLTSTLVENNIFTLAIAGLTIFHGGRYLERAWSSAEFAKFLLVASLIPNTITFIVLILFFSMTRDERWGLTIISGTIPLQISFLVAFSQLVPAHTVTLFRGILSLRVPRFPLLYIGLVTLLTLTPLLTMASLSLAISGFFASWTYLRFYKPVFPDLDSSQPTSLRGDPSESFALAEFFPAPARPFVAALSQTVFGILVSLRICSPFESTPGSAHGGGGYSLRSAPAPGSARAEAERRRALALKALDQRLSAATAAARAGTGASQAPAGSGAASASPAPPPNQPTGPTVQSQPKPGAQNTMTQPLGETSYNPDDSGDKS